MMMMLKVLMQCSSFYNMIHQNLHMYNNFFLLVEPYLTVKLTYLK